MASYGSHRPYSLRWRRHGRARRATVGMVRVGPAPAASVGRAVWTGAVYPLAARAATHEQAKRSGRSQRPHLVLSRKLVRPRRTRADGATQVATPRATGLRVPLS